MGGDVTGSQDRAWLHPVDWGKFWELALIELSSCSDVLSLFLMTL